MVPNPEGFCCMRSSSGLLECVVTLAKAVVAVHPIDWSAKGWTTARTYVLGASKSQECCNIRLNILRGL